MRCEWGKRVGEMSGLGCEWGRRVGEMNEWGEPTGTSSPCIKSDLHQVEKTMGTQWSKSIDHNLSFLKMRDPIFQFYWHEEMRFQESALLKYFSALMALIQSSLSAYTTIYRYIVIEIYVDCFQSQQSTVLTETFHLYVPPSQHSPSPFALPWARPAV